MVYKPLSNMKVLDLTHYIAGPYCTKIIAALGADVIKVEKPEIGDDSRKLGPYPQDDPHLEKSGLFLYLNMGKKSISLNLKHPLGQKILLELVAQADVLVENFEPRVMPGLGLDFNTLKKVNPRLVMTSISNFGQNGSYKDYQITEIGLFSMGGLMYTRGLPEREPLSFSNQAVQYLGGLVAFTSTMTALFYAKRKGIGQQIDVSLMECVVSSHPQAMVQYAYTGTILDRRRLMFVFPCKDGFIGMSLQPNMWPRFTAAIGMEELTDDPCFRTDDDRRQNYDELETLVLPWMIQRTKQQIYRRLQEVRVPVGYFANSRDVLRSRQNRARRFFVKNEHPCVGKLTYPGIPFKMGRHRPGVERAPFLGEHNETILCDQLGCSKDYLIQLKKKGVI